MTIYTDARLDEMEHNSHPAALGPVRTARYLRRLADPDLRDKAMSEATIMRNMTPGWRPSDAVDHIVRLVERGDYTFPYIKRNSDMLAAERRQREAKLARDVAALGLTIGR